MNIGQETNSIVSCSTRDTPPSDLGIMTLILRLLLMKLVIIWAWLMILFTIKIGNGKQKDVMMDLAPAVQILVGLWTTYRRCVIILVCFLEYINEIHTIE